MVIKYIFQIISIHHPDKWATKFKTKISKEKTDYHKKSRKRKEDSLLKWRLSSKKKRTWVLLRGMRMVRQDLIDSISSQKVHFKWEDNHSTRKKTSKIRLAVMAICNDYPGNILELIMICTASLSSKSILIYLIEL